MARKLYPASYNRKPVYSVLFHTHYRCQLRCTHCYEKYFKRSEHPPLTLAEKKGIIWDCLNLGALSFDFVSGESALDPDLPELIRACRPDRTYLSLATNGCDWSLEKIKNFQSMGIDKFNISLDSWDAGVHDALRGRDGVHQEALQTVKWCRQAGIQIQLTVCVFNGYTSDAGFRKLVDYAIRNRIRLAFKAAVPLGAWEGQNELLINQEDRDYMACIHKQHPFLTRTCVGEPDSVCPAFNKLIAITAYGDVLPCNTIHISFGNLREESLKSIIERGRKTNYFKTAFQGCPPAEDLSFIEKYLSKTYSRNPYPVKSKDIFRT